MPHSVAFNLQNERQLHIFGVSANRHLTIRDVDVSGRSDEFHPSDATNTDKLSEGNILVPGSIATVRYQDWTRTYGWVERREASDLPPVYQLSMLSPVQAWIDDVITNNETRPLAGASAYEDDGDAFLYYTDKRKLWELSLGGGSPSEIEVTGQLAEGTHIAATRGTDRRRYIAYQLQNNMIQVYNKDKEQALPKNHDSDMAMERTPLAIVQYERYGESIIDLYYIKASGKHIVRSRRVDDYDAEWQEQTIKDSGYLPDLSTSISAVWDPEWQKVILTYTRHDGRVISFRDREKWNAH